MKRNKVHVDELAKFYSLVVSNRQLLSQRLIYDSVYANYAKRERVYTYVCMDIALCHVQNRKAIPFVVYCFRDHYDTHRLTQKVNRWNDRKLRKNPVPTNNWNGNRSNERYACVPGFIKEKKTRSTCFLFQKCEAVLRFCSEQSEVLKCTAKSK